MSKESQLKRFREIISSRSLIDCSLKVGMLLVEICDEICMDEPIEIKAWGWKPFKTTLLHLVG